VWLDRGELDKILDRAAAETPAAPRPGSQQPSQPSYQESYQGDARHGAPQRAGKPKRMEHWLSELLG